MLFATSPTSTSDTTSFLDFSAWKDQSHAFTGAAAYRHDPFNITGDGAPEPIMGVRASHELLNVLGVHPVIGRGFTQGEQQSKLAVALISHGLWTRRYGSDPHILERTILLNEVSHSVIGVLPPGFEFLPFHDTDVVVPVLERTCRSCGYIRAVARLKPGVPASAAQQELDAIAAALETAFPASNEKRGVNVVPLRDVAVGPVQTPLLVLFGAGVCVLLIGCANVGNLVLARGISRKREFAVRSALGAGHGRLVRQLLTESISLALIAGLIGSVLAFWGSEFLVASLSQRFPLPEIPFNWTLLAFACVIAILSGVLSGVPLALMVGKADVNESLKQDSRSQSGGVRQHRLGNLLVVAETTLTVVLLMGAGLLVRSFIRLQQVDLGVNTRQALTADLILSKRYVDPERREVYLQQLLNSVATLPGVQDAAVHADPPFTGGGWRETFKVEGHADPRPDRGHAASFNAVRGRFFRAMDIPVTRGRDFTDHDTAGSPLVAIINETMARQFWPDGDAVGKRLHFYYDKDPQRWLSIVGVARDVRYHGRYSDPVPQVFVPGQQPFYKAQDPYISLVVRTAGNPAPLVAAVQARIWAVDKDQPIAKLQPMDQTLWESAAAPRVYMLLLGTFAVVALVIAGAGIFAVSAYAVVRRTQEIGIRLALGATSGQILSMVLGHGMLLILIGAGLGVAGTLALTQVMAGLLYGITPTDTPTFLAVLLLFAGVAFFSTYLPARRAAAIDPTIAVRAE